MLYCHETWISSLVRSHSLRHSHRVILKPDDVQFTAQEGIKHKSRIQIFYSITSTCALTHGSVSLATPSSRFISCSVGTSMKNKALSEHTVIDIAHFCDLNRFPPAAWVSGENTFGFKMNPQWVCHGNMKESLTKRPKHTAGQHHFSRNLQDDKNTKPMQGVTKCQYQF